LQILSEELKRNIRESLAYALTQVKSETQIRLVIQEFYHSLNRKHLLLNYEVPVETAECWRIVEDLADSWKFVSNP